jgi:hypothetical protein
VCFNFDLLSSKLTVRRNKVLRYLFPALLVAILFIAACAAPASRTDSAAQSGNELKVEKVSTTSDQPWRYPIAAGVWYPGDGPVSDDTFNYYHVRCWPGCHDPNTQPRPYKY